MKIFKKELLFLILILILFIAVRSVNYIYHLNWSGDQASCGIEALRIFRTKTLTLIGPQISANLQGRFIFQGPLIYYGFLFFLLLGKWDPVISSYLFMIFCSLMIFPLFYGTKKLINEKAAWIIIVIYSFIPYYLNYTRFLWNSTLLFSLLPILIFFMGMFNKQKKIIVFLLLSIWLGVLLQFHYQFIIVIFGILLYYFLKVKLKPYFLLAFIAGIAVGFSPLIFFELKHNFYNTKTIILFIQNWSNVDKPGGITMPHYYITLSFMTIVAVIGIVAKRVKKVSYIFIIIFGLIVATYSLILNIQQPQHAFWAPASPWNYLTEKRIYDIIRSTKMTSNFNVANLAYYDTPSVVIKYFMKRDGYNINYDDYYHNRFLFVISEENTYENSRSYEVATFQPRKTLKSWKINERFNMYLLERI